MVKNQVQLITYVDRLAGGGLPELKALLEGPLAGLFGGVHLLPFFDPIDGADAGFDPVDHTRIDPRLGDWADIKALSHTTGVMADLIANHISRQSPQAQDWLAQGPASDWHGLLLTRESVFGTAPDEAALKAIYRPRPGLPFSEATLGSGETVQLWTTFTPDQVDIDVTHPLGEKYLDGILQTFAANGVTMVRLDAVGYCIKKPGTSCFMLPETFAYIDRLSARVRELGMAVLVEIHSYYQQQIAIAKQVDWVYDFALPPLLLHAFAFKTAAPLKHWLQVRPTNALTVLDTHDGIGVIDIGPDGSREKPGLVPSEELDQLVEIMHENSQGQRRQHFVRGVKVTVDVATDAGAGQQRHVVAPGQQAGVVDLGNPGGEELDGAGEQVVQVIAAKGVIVGAIDLVQVEVGGSGAGSQAALALAVLVHDLHQLVEFL